MTPSTASLSSTDPDNGVESLSCRQPYHVNAYVTGPSEASSEPFDGIGLGGRPAQRERAFELFLTEYHWGNSQIEQYRTSTEQFRSVD